MRNCLIIFAKEPQKGKVKTRLKDYLSQEQCLNLYKAFLKDVIDLAKKIKCSEKLVAYDSKSNPEYLRKIARPFKFYKQCGRNLGYRMHNAFKFASEDGGCRMVVMGSDSPNLPISFIEGALKKLDRNDVVLGPSLDGGYYLIGMKKPCLGLFQGIKWSSDKVLDETIKKSRQLKKKIAILPRWYDVDESKSLNRLIHDLKKAKDKNIAKWTKKFLKVQLKTS